jgi:CelD/BcsL family acetyltransferase involved in cellulose biosynthesis
MPLACISNWDELRALAPAWNELAQGNPFRSWQWLGSWWRHYGPGEGQAGRGKELFVLAVRDAAGALVGLAPWYLQRRAARGNVVRFLGSGEVCTDYSTVLCRKGQEGEVAATLADWLVEMRKSDSGSGKANGNAGGARWDCLEFNGIASDDACMNRLAERLGRHGAVVDRRPAESCWRLELPASWDEYLGSLSKSHRKQLRRFQRRLFDRGRAVLYTATTAAELEHAFGLLVDLHERRRRSLGERGRFDSPRFTAFHRDVTRQFFDLGRLGLSWLELDARPVACEYQLLGDGIIYAYQSGIEPAAVGEEPGRLATLAILRAAIESGQRTYDLLRGDEAYKAHWRATPLPCTDFRVLPGQGADWLRHGVWVVRENVRNWAKAGRLRTGANNLPPLPSGEGRGEGNPANEPNSNQFPTRPLPNPLPKGEGTKPL